MGRLLFFLQSSGVSYYLRSAANCGIAVFSWTNFIRNDLRQGIANNLKMHTLLTKLLTLKGFCKGLSLALQPRQLLMSMVIASTSKVVNAVVPHSTESLAKKYVIHQI